ncbi:unnamed protein product [Spirodela intermedia]|uniref:Hexosyltransferase n=1 Tax=Spirodela intermedia TaxID=51605 RepID=A0A7I8J8D3_SPIIN|nr:unnamed protein product [Spirodela intermedia]CAA6665702.1 unnamed protein product [Spirodela intermedia]
MDHKVQLARLQESVFWRLASDGIPKSMHCLSLRLKEEYYINALARSPLPPPEYVSRLDNQSLVHIAVLTDNVLAASVVVSSTVKRSANPEDLVFHIVTDKKTYASMHSWFALNPVFPAVVVVKGLHQFDWPSHVGLAVLETVKLHQTTWEHVILLHDDTVVCRDLSPLWSLDLQGKVNGAVNTVKGNGDSCVGDTFGDYLNFSRTEISTQFDRHECAWIGGINVFDLKAWRQTNISKAYQHWLKLNLESGFLLWEAGTAPPALIAFEGHTHPIDPSWHLWGLGLRRPAEESLPSAAVLHFSGPAKPWLAVGFPELRNLWEEHVDYSNELVKSCAGVE